MHGPKPGLEVRNSLEGIRFLNDDHFFQELKIKWHSGRPYFVVQRKAYKSCFPATGIDSQGRLRART